jgi:hypothetical protein
MRCDITPDPTQAGLDQIAEDWSGAIAFGTFGPCRTTTKEQQ